SSTTSSARSSTVTGMPRCASSNAATEPTGPPPTINTRSCLRFIIPCHRSLAHRRHAQPLARRAECALCGAGDRDQALVIAALGNKLQPDRHAETIETDRQGSSAKHEEIARHQIVHDG